MPQMAPTLWLSLMFMFMISLLIVFSLTYYINIPSKISKQLKMTKMNEKIWNW